MAKVIQLPPDHFLASNTSGLSPQMLTTLKKAYEMQKQKIPFGQKDIDGSFNALLTRGFIKTREDIVDGEKVVDWYVTDSAISVLKGE